MIAPIRLLLALALIALLQSCAGGKRALTDSGPSSGNTPPPITVVEMNGIPAEQSQMLTDFMAEAAGKRDIAIVQGAFGDGFRLDGAFTATAEGNGTVIGYQWKLSDASGQELHAFSGSERAGPAAADPWAAAVSDVLRRIAAGTADNLAARLQQMGYAVRLSAFEAFPPLIIPAFAGRTNASPACGSGPKDRWQAGHVIVIEPARRAMPGASAPGHNGRGDDETHCG